MSSESIVKTNPPELHVPVDNLYTHVASARAGWVHRIGGQVPVDRAGGNVAPGDMAAQIREVYRQVTIALAAAGCTWAEVIHIYTFTTDMDSYLAAERDIAPAYLGDHPPASTLVEVSRLVDRDWLVEVQVDAVGGTLEGQHV
jgi:enamine deaminase RidA (YjgF/YER057c/UK114 family)